MIVFKITFFPMNGENSQKSIDTFAIQVVTTAIWLYKIEIFVKSFGYVLSNLRQKYCSIQIPTPK